MGPTKRFVAFALGAALAGALGAVGAGATAGASGGGSKLAPVGARQPAAGATLASCDAALLGPAGGAEGACTLDQVTLVAVDKAHAVALKSMILDVVSTKQITTINVRGGSVHPLGTDAWIAIKVQAKNKSKRAAQLRDEQFDLRLGGVRYPDNPEATDSERDSLTKPNRKLGKGKVRSGTLVFAVPSADVGMLTTPPSGLFFVSFGGDPGLNEFPGNAVGFVRLYQ